MQMNVKITPRKRKALESNPILDEEDLSLIASVPELLIGTVKQRFHEYDSATAHFIENTIIEQKRRNVHDKRTFLHDAVEAYDILMKSIQEAQVGPLKKMTCLITGKYLDCRQAPTVSYWKACNPGKSAAIGVIFDELSDNGWNPKIQDVTEFTLNDGVYCQGTELIITCNFAE